MNEESEINKEMNLLTPLMNIINSILSLNQQNVFKNNEKNNNNVFLSFGDDIKYCFKVLILDESTFNFISPLLNNLH